MASRRFSTPILTRQDLEKTWRRRLEQSHDRYHRARTDHRKLLQRRTRWAASRFGQRFGPSETRGNGRPHGVLQLAPGLLTTYGKLPDDGSAALLEHGPGRDEFVISIIEDDESLRDSTTQLFEVGRIPSRNVRLGRVVLGRRSDQENALTREWNPPSRVA